MELTTTDTFGVVCDYLEMDDLLILMLVGKTVRRMVLQTDKFCHILIDDFRFIRRLKGFAVLNKLGVLSVTIRNSRYAPLDVGILQWILTTFSNLERLHIDKLSALKEEIKEIQEIFPLRILRINSMINAEEALFSLITHCPQLRTFLLPDARKIYSLSDLQSCSQLVWLDVSVPLSNDERPFSFFNEERMAALEEIASLPMLRAIYALGRFPRQPKHPKIIYQDLHQQMENWAQVKPMLSVNASGLGLFMQQIIWQCLNGSPSLKVIQDLIDMGAPLTPFKHTNDFWRPQYPRLPGTGDQIFWPFASALERSQFDVCNLLIENGLDIKSIRPTSLMQLNQWHVRDWDIPLLEFLRNHGVDLNACDSDGQTLLMIAIKSSSYHFLDYLLALIPSDLESREKNAIHVFYDIVERYKVDPNDSEMRSALNKVIQCGKFSHHSRDADGRTPLMVALDQNLFVDLMMQHAKDAIDDVDDEGQTPLLRFLRKYYFKLKIRRKSEWPRNEPKMDDHVIRWTKMMLDMSSDVNIASNTGDTPFMYIVGISDFAVEFAKNPRGSVYETIINAGADVHIKGKDGWTPLMMACLRQNDVFVSDLLSRGCDVAACDDYGITPLMASLITDPKTWMVNELVKNGASVNVKNCYGMTPLHFTDHDDHKTDVLKLILENGGDVNAADDMGRTPLHIAMKKCIPDSIEMMLKFGADINAQDNQGRITLSSFFRSPVTRYQCDACEREDESSPHR
eukprot:TRINITY_DN6030_c0_g2_i2.p1 TRINITY_DN6030_c0_g2~~TRINITY_DN6030_c0_g2_i2.p1  ORF type:complete len:739 (+),score=166.95 TRINITY_DN6030_c0_g2_i2:1-2217(+)